ncbi:MAG: tetratricopeptide repeat protein [Nitrospirota bacterium]
MKHLVFLIVFAISSSFVFVHPKTLNASPPVSSPSTSSKTAPSVSAESYYHVMSGLRHETEGQFEKALEAYKKAEPNDPNSPFLMTRMAVSSARIGELKNAVALAEKANQLKPGDHEILNLLADLYAAGDSFESVVATYHKIIEQAPNEIEGYLNLAEFLAKEQRLDEAIVVAQRGLLADPESHIGHYYLAKLYAGQKEYAKGIEHYQEAARLHPAFLHAHLSAASLYEFLEKFEEAEKIYRHILKQSHLDHEEAGMRLVAILTEKKAFPEAMTILNQLSASDPKNSDFLLKISLLWAEQKEYKNALDALQKVMDIQPLSSKMKSYLASLYEGTEQYDQAIQTYQEMLAQGENRYDMHLRLGEIYFYRLKKYPEALSAGENAILVDQKRHEAYLLTGLVLYESEQFEDAVERFLEGIEISPNQPSLHFHLGVTYDKINLFDKLVLEMKRALAIDGNHVMSLNYLGYTYADRGIFLDEAVSLIDRALKIRPEDGYIMDSLGWAYYKQGKTKEALSLLEKAVVLAPDDPVILEHLGEVYLKENQKDKTREVWARALRLDSKNEKLKTRFHEAGFFLSPEETAPLPKKKQMGASVSTFP